MPKYIDQIGNAVHLEKVDSIISLVPSQTELLFHLGLDDKVIGITKFCIKPDTWFRTKTRIGGTKNLNLQLIDELKPDLIIGNKEENSQGDIEELIKRGHKVWMSDIFSDSDNIKMIEQIGLMTDRKSKSDSLVNKLQDTSEGFTLQNIKVAYFIWKDPYFIVGSNSYIDFNLNKIGLINVAKHLSRYQEISIEEVNKLNADYLLFSSEPYPFQEKNLEEMEQLFGKEKCVLVDGEMFSWTGYRPLLAIDYFKTLIKQLTAVNKPN